MTSNFYISGGAAMTSRRDDWETPADLFARLDARYHFDLDPCATPDNAKCQRFFTKEQDGLAQDWGGCRVFCNPPYGRGIGKWVAKAAAEAKKPGTLVVLLLPARTETGWFHDYLYHQADIEFIRGRLHYSNSKEPAPFGSMVCILGGTK